MWTVKLLKADHVPSDFREPFIVHGYRSCRSTVKTCLISALNYTNETLNFWTHFLGFVFFLWKLCTMKKEYVDYRDPFTWAFSCYMLSCCIYLFTSSLAHLFSCMSEWWRHVCFFLDYGALSIYSYGSGIAYTHYNFPTDLLNSSAFSVFQPVMFVNALLCTALACNSRLMSEGKLRKISRILAFFMPYVWCSIPLLYRINYCSGEECSAASLEQYKLQFYLAFITGSLYASHFPEVLAPGRFDYLGHSHQIFHVCGVIATYKQFEGLIMDMTDRKELLLGVIGPATMTSAPGSFATLLILDLIIIGAFSLFIWHPHSLRRVKLKQGIKTIPPDDSREKKFF